MIAYATIGIPCGVMEAKCGLDGFMAFLFSATYYSGAGQFMFTGMAMAGASLGAIASSISLVNTRQILYSAALAPFVDDSSRLRTLLFAATVTDESFGLNLDRLSGDDSWDVTHGLVLNIFCMLSWSLANGVGALLGPVITVPTATLSFAMTAIFICLLVGQLKGRATVACMLTTFMVVGICKFTGLSGVSILIGSVAGVAAGLVLGTGSNPDTGAADVPGDGGAA